jgi:hypothetical protein
MAYQKLQAGSAIPVVPSDTISIPAGGGVQLSGTTTGTGADLEDSTASFLTTVKVGYIVVDNDTPSISTVVSVDSNTELTLSGGVTLGGTASYTIYAGPETNGCALYVGVAGDVKVKMSSGKDVIFTAVPAGSFMPVQVKQVFATGTTATNIVALW